MRSRITFYGEMYTSISLIIRTGLLHITWSAWFQTQNLLEIKFNLLSFPGGSVDKNPPANSANEDMVSIPDLGRSHMLQSN